MSWHAKANHNFNEKENVCNLCDRIFSTKLSIKKHMEVVYQGNEKYPCDKCQETFKTKTYLRKHFQSKQCTLIQTELSPGVFYAS